MKRLNLVGLQVRRLRYARNWSQEQLAAKLQVAGLDLSRSGVSKIEAGIRRVSDLELFTFAAVLQISCDTLLSPTAPLTRSPST